MSDAIKILAIDDSEDDRALYRRALMRTQAPRYQLDECGNGDEGLARIDCGPTPECVLLDYSLPGRNGVEILKRLRAKHPFVPVVMLTGQGNEEIAVSAMREGAQNYLAKSAVTSEEIHRTIQMAMAHCAMERRIHEQRVSLETFTRALAHDLKEPVRTISSFLGLAKTHVALAPRERGYFQHIEDAAARMAALIDAVYIYTRLADPAQQVGREPCAGARLFEEVRADLSELIRERGAIVTAGELPELNVNAIEMRRVLQNLVCNAIRHSDAAPWVHVDAQDGGDHWVVRVADNGPGVEPAMRARIFDPFKRLGPRKEGLGLGLAIARRVVEAHGGRIWCEGRAEGGALFCFTASKAPPQGERIGRIEASGPQAADTPKPATLASILIVDDNEVDLELARILLAEEDKLRCDLKVANGGREALAMLSDPARGAESFDLMLLDINMPGMDGFELLQHMREGRGQDVPVVMCTTSNYDKDVAAARDLGAIGYMTKPARLSRLKAEFEKIPALQLVEEEGGHVLVRVH